MDASLFVYSILFFILGVAAVYIAHALFGTVGTLRIDHSDPDKDVYNFDVKDLDKIAKKTYIVMLIDNDADLSQK